MILSLRDCRRYLQTFLIVCTGEWWREGGTGPCWTEAGRLLNILQCTGSYKFPATKNCPARMVTDAEMEKAWLRESPQMGTQNAWSTLFSRCPGALSDLHFPILN